MREAIEETGRRRRIQEEFNRKNNITPQSISKAIQDILVRKKEESRSSEAVNIDVLKQSFNILIPKQRKELVSALEKQMLELAKDLEFERAAVIRDEINKIHEQFN
jgi:excinuclease ABC subunit B